MNEFSITKVSDIYVLEIFEEEYHCIYLDEKQLLSLENTIKEVIQEVK